LVYTGDKKVKNEAKTGGGVKTIVWQEIFKQFL
jgi:hypothetical protein